MVAAENLEQQRALDRADEIDSARPEVGGIVEGSRVPERPGRPEPGARPDQVSGPRAWRVRRPRCRGRDPNEDGSSRSVQEGATTGDFERGDPDRERQSSIGKIVGVEEPSFDLDRRDSLREPVLLPRGQHRGNRIGQAVSDTRGYTEKEAGRPAGRARGRPGPPAIVPASGRAERSRPRTPPPARARSGRTKTPSGAARMAREPVPRGGSRRGRFDSIVVDGPGATVPRSAGCGSVEQRQAGKTRGLTQK